MDRRKSIKTLGVGLLAPAVLVKAGNGIADLSTPETVTKGETVFTSAWHQWPDMNWAGPECWGNRLQDWRIRNGKLECIIEGTHRTLHCLTAQLGAHPQAFETSVTVTFPEKIKSTTAQRYAGFRLGAKAVDRNDDYRCAAVFGEGLDAGITVDGRLFIGKQQSDVVARAGNEIKLLLQATPAGAGFQLTLAAYAEDNTQMGAITAHGITNKDLTGNMALVVHFADEVKMPLGISAEGDPLDSRFSAAAVDEPSAIFSNWTISGAKVSYNPEQTFGPICFAQYTIHHNILKLTAQLTPVETVPGYKLFLEVKENNHWQNLREGSIDTKGRCATFRIENWQRTADIPYRVRLELPLKDGNKTYLYEGTIAAEPTAADKLKVAVFSCNGDYGFPDAEIAPHVAKHRPQMAVFLGDQFYESHGGFDIQTFPVEKSYLDYLRKWYMFGWSYREVFRHVPCAIIPDDHDVYHGNVWGEGGNHASSEKGWDYRAQDLGGFKMPAAWVNMIQHTQTSHLPDPYDPTPVKQGIHVYYTKWNYAGISFAILEDRKFKSAPKNVLPPEAKINNGFIQNPAFDIKEHRNIDAVLLGERQMKFLEDWSSDWRDGAQMKCLLSQTNFCTVATLPKGSITDSIVPGLPIPQPGEYIEGDAPTSDMDSNGWPQNGRDEAIRTIRKCFAFHIAGDQHIASMVRYGVDEFADAGYAFAGPALNNIFPRRWWPSRVGREPLPGQPPYTGNFFDGFGNRMTVLAVANPAKTNRQPVIVYDRATGYGIVTFDKTKRTIHVECWPRYIDPEMNRDGQYKGWPFTITQEDNYARKAVAWLPAIKVVGVTNPVLEVLDARTNESLYTVRMKGRTYKPRVFAEGVYTIRISDPDKAMVKEFKNIRAGKVNNKTMVLSV